MKKIIQLTNNEMLDYLREIIKSNLKFALIRFGDGEGVFAFLNDHSHPRYLEYCEKHWNEVPDINFRRKISNNIKESYVKCDIAGLSFNIDTFWQRYSVNRFLEFKRAKILCSSAINLYMEKFGFFEEIIPGKKVFYVGCRNLDKKFMEMGAESVDRILISPQYKFENVKPKIPFYKQTDDVEKEIMKKDLHGTLCFLAAGVAGKQLGLFMRERGGMVIDAGSIFDKWADVKSRGWIVQNKYAYHGQKDELMPMMHPDQIKLLRELFSKKGKKELNILEWGSGGSTVYFPEYLKSNGINFNWYSIEHNKEWYEKIKNATLNNKNIHLYLEEVKEIKNALTEDDFEAFDAYVNFPRKISKKKYDFIFIDGRSRANCMEVASKLVRADGTVILHDAERKRYHHAFELYEKYKIFKSAYRSKTDVSHLWIGGNIDWFINSDKDG